MDGTKHASRGSHRRVFHPGIFAVAGFAAAALWLILVGSSSPHEMYVGVASVLLTMLFVHSVGHSLGINLDIRWRDLAQGVRIPWYLLTGNWEIIVVLFRDLFHVAPPQNRFRVCGFDSSRHDPVRIARTVMAVAFTTAAPNFIVIGIDPSQSRMLFHQVSPTSVQRMARALGAKG